MKTVADMWEDYRKFRYGKYHGTIPIEMEENLKRAFYAGFLNGMTVTFDENFDEVKIQSEISDYYLNGKK